MFNSDCNSYCRMNLKILSYFHSVENFFDFCCRKLDLFCIFALHISLIERLYFYFNALKLLILSDMCNFYFRYLTIR